MENFGRDVKRYLGLTLNARQLAAFAQYERELMAWNARFNLTGIRDSDGIRTKHFLDSLTLLPFIPADRPQRLVDIGTGAGFPGLPLRILLPNLSVTLVESVGKKVEFCRHVVNTLGLSQVNAIKLRAEEMGQDPSHRETYDVAVARAVAYLPVLVEYLLPLVKVGGLVLAQKGESGPAEAHLSEKGIRLLGGEISQLHKVELPGVVEERYIIVIKKVAVTPPQYPRRVGIPSQKPL